MRLKGLIATITVVGGVGAAGQAFAQSVPSDCTVHPHATGCPDSSSSPAPTVTSTATGGSAVVVVHEVPLPPPRISTQRRGGGPYTQNEPGQPGEVYLNQYQVPQRQPRTVYVQNGAPQRVMYITSQGTYHSWHYCDWIRPYFNFGLDGGVGWAGGHGLAGFGNNVGGSWGARVGVDILPFLGLDAHYFGMVNGSSANGPEGLGRAILTNAGYPTLRLTVPTPYVRPYVFGGAGIYTQSLLTTGAATIPLRTTVSVGVPMGVGIEFPIDNFVTLGAEGTYHHIFNTNFSSDITAHGGADLLTINALLRFRI